MALRSPSWTRFAAVLACAAGTLATAGGLRAEDAPAPPALPAPVPSEAPATAPRLTRAQLRELVGPVAMYPDGVLASLLPATTFPLDVVAAARWLQEKGGKVEAVPEDRGWDASVVALLQFPDVVVWLNDNLAWMDQMGRAVAVQQEEVLQAVQDFRREAQAAGNLPKGDKLVAREEQAQGAPTGTTVIVVEPANPEVVYVPVYDPGVVCCRRDWGYPLYTFGVGFAFGALGFWGWHDIYWGWWYWPRNYGWYGGIYYHHEPFYWGHPHSYGSYAGPYRPRHWTSRYYPPGEHHPTSIAHPTTVRSAFPGRATAGAGATTGKSWVRPPRARLDAGVRAPPSPVSTTRAAPTWRRTTGFGVTGAGAAGLPKTGATAGGSLPSTRSAWTGRTWTRPSRVTTPGIDPSSVRGRTSLRYRASTSGLGTSTRTTGTTLRSFRAPSTRSFPSISSQSRSYSRPSVGQTRSWSSRGHSSLGRSSGRGASGRSSRR